MPFECEGTSDVLANVLRKKELFDAGDPAHEAIRSELYIDGGAMRGASGAGIAASLEKHGLFPMFDKAYGSSTGCPIGFAGCTGQVQEQKDVYSNYCSTEDFFSLSRIRKEGEAMNTKGLVAHLRTRFDVDALRASRTQLYGAVTCAQTGQGILMNMQEAEDPFTVLLASISLPWFSPGDAEIGGKKYLDGGGAYPFLAAQAARSNATDVLVIANSSKGEGPSALGRLAAPVFLKSLSPKALEAFTTQSQRHARDLAEFRTHHKTRRQLVLWMRKNALRPLEQNRVKLETAIREGELFMDGLIAKCRQPLCA